MDIEHRCSRCGRLLWSKVQLSHGLREHLCPGTGTQNCIVTCGEESLTDTIRKGAAAGILTQDPLDLPLSPEEMGASAEFFEAWRTDRRAERDRAFAKEDSSVRELLQGLCDAYGSLVPDPKLPVEEQGEIMHHLEILLGRARKVLK